MGGIGIIANPHANLNKRNPDRPRLLSYIAGERGQCIVTQDLDHLRSALHTFYTKKIDILAINGGDGTISQTITAMVDIYQGSPMPAVAVLKGGTMNMLADNLGIKGTPPELLSALLNAHASGEWSTKSLSSLNINNFIGFLFASHTSARFLEQFYLNKSGPLGAIRLIATLCAKLLLQRNHHRQSIVAKEPLQIQIDSHPPILMDPVSVLCSTVKNMPLGLPFFTHLDATKQKGQVSFVCLEEREIAYKLLMLLISPQHSKNMSISSLFSRMLIKSKEEILYTLDGEIFRASSGSLKIDLGPNIQFAQCLEFAR